MSDINQQIDIIEKLSQIIHASAIENYELATCKFSLVEESVGENFIYIKDGETISTLLSDPSWLVMDLVIELHEIMKVNTGGDWIDFTLTLDKNGKANTKFTYNN